MSSYHTFPKLTGSGGSDRGCAFVFQYWNRICCCRFKLEYTTEGCSNTRLRGAPMDSERSQSQVFPNSRGCKLCPSSRKIIIQPFLLFDPLPLSVVPLSLCSSADLHHRDGTGSLYWSSTPWTTTLLHTQSATKKGRCCDLLWQPMRWAHICTSLSVRQWQIRAMLSLSKVTACHQERAPLARLMAEKLGSELAVCCRCCRGTHSAYCILFHLISSSWDFHFYISQIKLGSWTLEVCTFAEVAVWTLVLAQVMLWRWQALNGGHSVYGFGLLCADKQNGSFVALSDEDDLVFKVSELQLQSIGLQNSSSFCWFLSLGMAPVATHVFFARSQVVDRRGHLWGCSAMQGWRTNMEALRGTAWA